MKLIDRQAVEGTTPTIYIGHRPYPDKLTGKGKVSKTWYAEYCTDGRSHYEPLKTTNKNEAIRGAHKIVDRLETGQAKVPSRRRDIGEVVKAYLDMQTKRNRAPKTLEKYSFVLNELMKWVDAHGRRAAAAFSEHDFWDFYQKMNKDGLSEKTRHDRSIIIKQMFKWAAGAAARLIPGNPLAGVSLDDPAPTRQPCFTPEQVGSLLKQADNHHRPIYAVMAYAGLRFGEVRDLLWQDVLLEQGQHGFIVVQRGGSDGRTKSGRIRRIPIHPKLAQILKELPKRFDRVFTANPSAKYPDGGGPIDERRLLMSLKRLCRRCKFINPKQYKLHTFRHAFASMCARNNVSYKYALEWMGHKSSDILDLYYTMFDETAEAAIRTIDYPVADPSKRSPAA
jgi:integrase